MASIHRDLEKEKYLKCAFKLSNAFLKSKVKTSKMGLFALLTVVILPTVAYSTNPPGTGKEGLIIC